MTGDLDVQSPADAQLLESIFRERQTGCASRINKNSHVAVYLNPSSEVGPERVHIPVSGHNVVLELIAARESDVWLAGISASIKARKPLRPDGVSVTPQPGNRFLALADDLAASHQRALMSSVPLEIPHLEILLDCELPIVRPAVDADGTNARGRITFPLQVHGGNHARLVLAPLTSHRDCIDWELRASVLCDGAQKPWAWDFQVTAETTYVSFLPDGRQEFTPVQQIAPHWYLQHLN